MLKVARRETFSSRRRDKGERLSLDGAFSNGELFLLQKVFDGALRVCGELQRVEEERTAQIRRFFFFHLREELQRALKRLVSPPRVRKLFACQRLRSACLNHPDKGGPRKFLQFSEFLILSADFRAIFGAVLQKLDSLTTPFAILP